MSVSLFSKVLSKTKIFLCSARSYSTKEVSILGRNFVKPRDFSREEIVSVLQTALHLKNSVKTPPNIPQELNGKTITYIADHACFKSQLSLKNAAQIVKMPLTTIIDKQLPEKWIHLSDAGKMLSKSSNIIVKNFDRLSKALRLTSGLTTPSFCIETCKYLNLQVLSDMLTVLEHYGKLDSTLTLSYFGRTGPLINTYLCVATRLGINVRFTCLCKSGQKSPLEFKNAEKECSKSKRKTIVKECKDLPEAIENTNIITTQRHIFRKLTITNEFLKKANENWIFLHPLPRTSIEVHKEVFDSQRNLTWNSFENQKWICAALIIKLLVNFKHDLPKPDL